MLTPAFADISLTNAKQLARDSQGWTDGWALKSGLPYWTVAPPLTAAARILPAKIVRKWPKRGAFRTLVPFLGNTLLWLRALVRPAERGARLFADYAALFDEMTSS